MHRGGMGRSSTHPTRSTLPTFRFVFGLVQLSLLSFLSDRPSPRCPLVPFQTNAAQLGDQPLGEFLHVAGLMVPLYAPRAAEVALYGNDAASLATCEGEGRGPAETGFGFCDTSNITKGWGFQCVCGGVSL